MPAPGKKDDKKSFGQDTQSQGFGLDHRLVRADPIGQYFWNFWNFSDPATAYFFLIFNMKMPYGPLLTVCSFDSCSSLPTILPT